MSSCKKNWNELKINLKILTKNQCRFFCLHKTKKKFGFKKCLRFELKIQGSSITFYKTKYSAKLKTTNTTKYFFKKKKITKNISFHKLALIFIIFCCRLKKILKNQTKWYQVSNINFSLQRPDLVGREFFFAEKK